MENLPSEDLKENTEAVIGYPVLKPKESKKYIIYILSFFVFISISYYFFISPPRDFVPGTILHVEQGETLRNISLSLKERNIIRSRTAFEIFVILYGGEKRLKYFDYLFENKIPVYEVARRVSKGEHHMAYISVTIPEGYTVREIADTFASKLVNFNKEKFSSEAKEGYMFPDTYFFLNIEDEQAVLSSMKNNFNKKVEPLLGSIMSSGKSENTIITMASIVENEAKGDSDREFISGILWHRINIGMPLQVDVAPETYKTRGLPKSPISNPGLASIKATLYPKNSPYLYYLHDKDGNIHYAKTFTEHKANISKYLK